MPTPKNSSGLKKIWLIIIGLVVILLLAMIVIGSQNQGSEPGQTTAENSGPGAADVAPAAPSEMPPAPEAKEVARVFEVVAPAENGYTVKDASTQTEMVLFIASDTRVEYLDNLTAIRPGHFLRVTRYREGANGLLALDMSVSREMTNPSGGSELPANPEAASNQ